MTTVLHVAPFDASRYPPLLQTLAVCRDAGIRSVVVASVPLRSPAPVTTAAELIAAPNAASGPAQLAFLGRRARAELARLRPDVVVAHNVRGLAAAAGLLARLPTLVYHCHDFEGEGWRGAALRRLEWLGSFRVDELWVPAPERAETARRRLLRGALRVVRNCPRSTPELPERGALRRWLRAEGAPGAEDAPLIVRHGSIGAAHCIRETVEVLPEVPDALFVVIGDGDRAYLDACREAAARAGVAPRFRVHPFVPHDRLNALLVDATVAMNLYAPLTRNAAAPAPNKVYESMAVGLPVVVTAGNSVAVDVLDAGAGLAVPLGDRAALAAALRAHTTDPEQARRHGAAGRAAHLARFHYEAQLAGTCLGTMLRR